MNYCNGTDPTIVANTQCTVPISVLMASPFNLQIGSSILVSIVSYNQVGDSPYSDVGSGAIIQLSLVPDAPLNLTRSNATLDKTKISLVWENGANSGNQAVLDYTLLT